MKYQHTFARTGRRPVAWLYSAVFGGKFSLLFTFVLLLSFLVQPFNQALAEETVSEDAPIVPAESVTMQTDADPTPEDMQSELDQTEISTETTTAAPATDSALDEDAQHGTTDQSEDAIDSTAEDTDIEVSESEDQSTASSTPDATTSSSSAVADEEALREAEADEQQPSELVTPYVISNDNFYQFSKQACVLVGNGAYHCSTAATADVSSDEVVFAEVGPGGNYEIYIKTKRGQIEQLTSNEYEDVAPQYDAGTGQIVWQRDIEGRYQIILHNLATRSETQLTFSRTNNMEPTISASGVVWQAWDGNDWEIMFYDGNYTEQLTDNDVPDIGPSIQDGYILWSVPGQNVQEARVYSLQSKEISRITSTEGGQIRNPRFVLVYDTEFENGDILTQSFDPNTGEAATIAASPAPEPIDIPQPDPVGEIRALLQNKSINENDGVVVETDAGAPDPELVPATTSSSTAGTAADLVIVDESVNALSSSSSTHVTDFELTEYDLVITPEAVSTTSTTSTQ